MTSATASSSTEEGPAAGKQPQDGEGMAGIIGGKIQEGEGGIKKALAEGKGWGEADILAYAKTIGDNHPMFAESLEVRACVGGRLVCVRVWGWFVGGLEGVCGVVIWMD